MDLSYNLWWIKTKYSENPKTLNLIISLKEVVTIYNNCFHKTTEFKLYITVKKKPASIPPRIGKNEFLARGDYGDKIESEGPTFVKKVKVLPWKFLIELIYICKN